MNEKRPVLTMQVTPLQPGEIRIVKALGERRPLWHWCCPMAAVVEGLKKREAIGRIVGDRIRVRPRGGFINPGDICAACWGMRNLEEGEQ